MRASPGQGRRDSRMSGKVQHEWPATRGWKCTPLRIGSRGEPRYLGAGVHDPLHSGEEFSRPDPSPFRREVLTPSPPHPLSLRERGNAILPSGWRNIGLALGRLWFAAAELEAGDVECRGNRAEPLIHPARGGVDAGSSASVNVPSAPAPLLAGIGMAEGRLA